MPSIIPNLFLIGAQKCGTTSTYRFLVNQRGIAGPALKEPNFLSLDHERADLRWRVSNKLYQHNRVFTRDAYLALYSRLPSDARWIVDGSASYLYGRGTAEAIKALAPDSRLVVLLRNPVERAFSEFMMQTSIGAESLSFRRAMESEIRKGHTRMKRLDRRYIWHGIYDIHLESYLRVFDRSALHIDCIDKPGETLKDVFHRISTFLGLEGGLSYLDQFDNIGTQSRYPILNNILYKSGTKAVFARMLNPVFKTRAKRLYYKRISAKVSDVDRARLWRTGFFNVERIESLSGLELDHWRHDRDRCII